MARFATALAGELVNKIAGEGAGLYGRYKNLPLETRAKEHFPTGELNSKMRSKKIPTELKNTKIEKKKLDRILAFNSPVENVPWLAFSVKDFNSVRKGPHPRPQFC